MAIHSLSDSNDNGEKFSAFRSFHRLVIAGALFEYIVCHRVNRNVHTSYHSSHLNPEVLDILGILGRNFDKSIEIFLTAKSAHQLSSLLHFWNSYKFAN